MYNVLSKLRSDEPLTGKDQRVHEQGLVSVLRQIHDDLDAALATAYGWPVDPPDDVLLLRRLVALNAERAAEERRGLVRWLRPDFQNPGGSAAVQSDLALPAAGGGEAATPAGKGKKAAAKKPAWPKTLAEQARAIRAALTARASPATPAELAAAFAGSKLTPKVAELLEALAALGQAHAVDGGRYAA